MVTCVCCRLNTGRQGHAMTAVTGGRVCVLGGGSVPTRSRLSSIELIESDGVVHKAGQLTYSYCHNVVCCGVSEGRCVLVCGANDDSGSQCVQVYDVLSQRVTHSVTLPYTGWPVMYGAVCTQGHLVVVSSE